VTEAGFTIDPVRGTAPRAGYAVAVHPERSWRIAAASFRPEHVARFIRRNAGALRAAPALCAGAWLDPATGVVHLDLSVVERDRRRALELARRHGQIGVFDLAEGRTLRRAP
jgi:hypothetical protein